MIEHLQESQITRLHFVDILALRDRVGPAVDHRTPGSRHNQLLGQSRTWVSSQLVIYCVRKKIVVDGNAEHML